MTNFYTTPLIEIFNEDETLTNEVSITVAEGSAVEISFQVPTIAKGVRIYRSTVTDSEELLVDLPLGKTLRKKSYVSVPMTFVDEGILVPQVGEDYPQSTTLTVDEQKAVPEPQFTLTEALGAGSYIAGTYFFRVSFYTQEDLGLAYVEDLVEVRLYQSDLIQALVSSPMALTSTDYTEVPDVFLYLDALVGEVTFSSELVNGSLVPAQELIWNNNVVLKVIAQRVSVTVQTETQTVIANKPVNLLVFPINESIEIIEGALVGPTELLSGVTSKVFVDPGSVVLFLSERAGLIYAMSPVSFTVT